MNIFLKKAQIKTWGSTSLSHINTLSQQPQSKTCKTKQRLPQEITGTVPVAQSKWARIPANPFTNITNITNK